MHSYQSVVCILRISSVTGKSHKPSFIHLFVHAGSTVLLATECVNRVPYGTNTDEDADHEACNGAAVGLTAVIFGVGDTVFFAVLQSPDGDEERIKHLVLVQSTDMIVVLLRKGA